MKLKKKEIKALNDLIDAMKNPYPEHLNEIRYTMNTGRILGENPAVILERKLIKHKAKQEAKSLVK